MKAKHCNAIFSEWLIVSYKRNENLNDMLISLLIKKSVQQMSKQAPDDGGSADYM